MATFVLIHGGLHGAWCWVALEPALTALGHSVIAVDLPVDQPGRGIADYARLVVAQLPQEPAYLVGHSLGGYVAVSVALEQRGTRVVMLCAGFPPTDGVERSKALAAADPANFVGMVHDRLDRIIAPPALARQLFFADLPPHVAGWAAAKLRPQWTGAFVECPIMPPYGDRIAAIIGCADDAIAPIAEQRRQAERHGADLHILQGGHSPFLAHPQALADLLDAIARRDDEGRR